MTIDRILNAWPLILPAAAFALAFWHSTRPKPEEQTPRRPRPAPLDPDAIIGGLFAIPILLAGLCWAALLAALFFSPLLLLVWALQ